MSDGENTPPSGSPEQPVSERLDSWKEIAAYLKRDIRTVQRWEKSEGLPAHRHLHGKRGSIYAYKPELDAWWQNGHARLEASEATATRQARSTRRWVLVGAAAAFAAMAGTVAYWWPRAPVLPFEERDWVLIAKFENRTGEPVFDGTLEHALERELSDSRFVNVVPRERVNDALRLMRKPPDTPVDVAIGREVCLRDGGIRGLLTGHVEKLGATYLLRVAVVNPVTGATAKSFDDEASGEKQVLIAMRRLSGKVREALGEALPEIQKSEEALDKVTTPSLLALQRFSQAENLIRESGSIAAEGLLREAIRIDPEFASAYIYLSWAIRNQGRSAEEYRPYAERAVALSEKASERERYFILGSYYQQAGEAEKAAVQYEALVRLYPDHYYAVSNLSRVYEQLGRPLEAARYVKRRAGLRPNDFLVNCRAAFKLMLLAGPDEARPYVGRARLLSNAGSVQKDPSCTAYIELYPAYEHLLQGNLERAITETNRVAGTVPSVSIESRSDFAAMVGAVYQGIGMLKRAEELYRQEPDAGLMHYDLAETSWDRGNTRSFKKHIREMSRYPQQASWGFPLGLALVHVGLLAEADKWVRKHENYPGRQIVQGELALARGRRAEGMRLLREGYASGQRGRGGSGGFLGAQELSRILEESGDVEGAVLVLEEVAQEKTLAVMNGASVRWIRNQYQLARLSRRLGREQEARTIEADLLKWLRHADSDHVIVRQLRESQELATRRR